MENQKIKVGIVGVAGYGGGELARLLSQHPAVDLTYVTSNSYDHKPLCEAFAGQSKRTSLVCEAYELSRAVSLCDFLFLAGEAGLAMSVAPDLLAHGKKVVDLSADFRLSDPAAYHQWYGKEHTSPTLLPQAVYGLPEFFRDKIKKASLVANPGCYPTSAILALAPLLKNDLIDTASIIIDSISGMSGSGRSKHIPETHFAEMNENLRPYGVGGTHRHVPEIEQILSTLAATEITVSFTPHTAPITRGILSTCYGNLSAKGKLISLSDMVQLYQSFYASEPFVVVLDEGRFPSTKHAYGSNACHIGIGLDKRTNRAVILSAEDNLIKGMAGQAIQNMNLMCGLDEILGLTMAGMWP